MTPFSVVYKSFLGKITDDMYMELTPQDTLKMLNELLESAILMFEFPRKSLDTIKSDSEEDPEDGYFEADLTKEEVNIIAVYMVEDWIGQQLASVENTRQKYSGTDFKFTSQAAHLSKLQSLKKEYERLGLHLQRLYKRRKKDSNGIYRSTMHTLMEPLEYPYSKGNEDPDRNVGEEDFWYER